jgi:hypothetical protein
MKIYYFGDSNTKGIGNNGSPIKDFNEYLAKQIYSLITENSNESKLD